MLLTRSNEVDQAEIYIDQFYNESLSEKNLIKALSLKWFRLNVMYFIKDKDGDKVKFRPNTAQKDFYINEHKNDIILKARQLGFTTFKMIADLDDCLFIENYSAGCIAHNDKAAKEIFRNKIKFAYESIGDSMRSIFEHLGSELPNPVSDRDGLYSFDNGSTLSVSTGFRGGTLQSLHVSEFGKICKKRPDVAEEIVTGAFQAVSKRGTKTIESTAEGKEGYFFQYCDEAEKRQKLNIDPISLEFKLHFYPWFKDPNYTIDEAIIINDRLSSYFNELKVKHGIELTEGQQKWYTTKDKELGDKVKQEYPSTPEEAFSNSIKGAYYSTQFAKIYEDGRICEIPLNEHLEVHTAWDLGVGDSTAIWFYQKVGNKYHIIDYYQNSGEGLQHYAKVLKSKNYKYGYHYAPHDIDNREFGSDAKSRKDIAYDGWEIDGKNYHIDFIVVPKSSAEDGIEAARAILDNCVFDVTIQHNTVSINNKNVSGLDCLESYRKEWNDKLGSYRDKPLHDWASDGADAFRYLAVAETKLNRFIGKSNLFG